MARPATPDDAAVVAELRTAYQVAEGDPTVITAEEQRDDWLSADLASDTVVVLAPDGRLAAHADVLNRRFVLVSVYGGVHPRHEHHGLGTYLVGWGAAWARDHMEYAPVDAQVAVQHYVNANNESACRLMQSLDYARVRTIYVMRRVMDTALETPAEVAGVRIRTFVPGRDERAVFEAVEDAFRDSWGRPAGTFERWLGMTERERKDPGLWYLAEDERTGEIAGVCLARVIPGGGGVWVGSVGVRRVWRGRGVALTLLYSAFGELYRRGEREVSLSVDADSPTGAPRLYMRAGMQVEQNIALYRKELRPGKDYSTLTAAADV
jgi:ribosomal protein S18 acetylase RimI-like enzyme